MIRALESGTRVILLFVIDRNLTKYRQNSERGQGFFFQSVVRLERALSLKGASLLIREGEPSREIGKLLAQYKIETVFLNREDTPYGLVRDKKIINDDESHKSTKYEIGKRNSMNHESGLTREACGASF